MSVLCARKQQGKIKMASFKIKVIFWGYALAIICGLFSMNVEAEEKRASGMIVDSWPLDKRQVSYYRGVDNIALAVSFDGAETALPIMDSEVRKIFADKFYGKVDGKLSYISIEPLVNEKKYDRNTLVLRIVLHDTSTGGKKQVSVSTYVYRRGHSLASDSTFFQRMEMLLGIDQEPEMSMREPRSKVVSPLPVQLLNPPPSRPFQEDIKNALEATASGLRSSFLRALK